MKTTPQEEKCECVPMFNNTVMDTSFCKLHTPQETMEELFEDYGQNYAIALDPQTTLPKRQQCAINCKQISSKIIEKARQEERIETLREVREKIEKMKVEKPQIDMRGSYERTVDGVMNKTLTDLLSTLESKE